MFRPITLFSSLLLATLVAGCGGSTEETNSPADNLSLRLQLPDSLTGGSESGAIAARIADVARRGGSGEPCSYIGPEDESDPFRNGYESTRFMISIMATWTCIADLLIDLSQVVRQDGAIHETDNDRLASNYDPEEPTHFSINADSDSQVTLRMYYGYPRSAPPRSGDVAQFYISWIDNGDDNLRGRMIVDAEAIDAQAHSQDDPDMMRMDFDFTAARRSADMYLRFDRDHAWADGFRIQVSRDEETSPLGQVFTARGLIEMKAQFLPLPGISEIPKIQLFTVADLLGNGAAIQEVQDLSLPLIVNIFRNNHLGDYLFSKRDIYFFEHDRDWEYIDKTVIASEYRGARNTAASGGSWLPFDPSLDMIIAALSLESDYFSGDKCAAINDDCNALLNAVFFDGFAGQEKNQGSDPLDWRSEALAAADYLVSIYPNGVDWSGAFEQNFTPDP